MNFVIVLQTTLLLLITSSVNATPLFEDNQLIEIELSGPISRLIENKEVREEYPFVLRTAGIDHEIEIRVRGKSRVRICDFPPLRLNFDVDQTASPIFIGQNHLKLVTHCKSDPRYQKNLLEEYLAYRIFNLISDVAYRVRLLRITYHDTDGRLDEEDRYRFGFVIEPRKQLASRSGAVPVHEKGIRLSQINQEQATLVYVFQYLVGNTDWSFVVADGDEYCCHNGDLLEIGNEIYYVPYDFDLSGIVNAAYAKPDRSMRLRNVKQRRYRGFCTDQDTLQAALRHVKSKQSDIFSLVREAPGLTEKDIRKIHSYLEGFFDRAEDENELLALYEKSCID